MKKHTQILSGILMMASLAGAAGTKNTKENPAQDRRMNYLEYIKTKQEITAITTGVDGLLKIVNEAKPPTTRPK